MTQDLTAYVSEMKEWQSDMEDRLRSPDSWLTLVGLHWLDEGANSIGTDSNNDIIFPEGTTPGKIGILILKDGQVTLEVNEGIIATINNNPITRQKLEPDTARKTDIVFVGEINFHIIVRGNRIGIRVKHSNSPLRVNFPGRSWWLIDREFRVNAEIIPYAPQKMVPIPDVLGDVNETAMDCQLSFTIHRQTYTLDAFALPSGQFYILFHDQSCGQGSYPSGRFLVTEYPEDNEVTIDFNKAHNPPCAFTPFATCPLPPPQNHLPIMIQAGERYIELEGYKH